MRSDRPTKNDLDSSAISLSLQTQRHLTPILPTPEYPTAPPLAARRPHSASSPAGADAYLHPRLIPSPPPHPRALNREFSLTLATGLPVGVEDDGPQSRRGSARLRLGLTADLPAMGAAPHPRHQGPDLPICGHRLPARSPTRASSGTPPAHRRRLRGVSRQSSMVLHSFLCTPPSMPTFASK
jgi:hypothetical protein